MVKKMLDVCLLGTGGMMPLPYRWLTALMARCEGSSLLIDCGEGTQIALKEKGWSAKPIDVICFTHYHADHISGLPGLLLTMGNAERTEPLLLVGPKGLERVVSALRTIAPELPFTLEYMELTEQEHKFTIGPYIIEAYRVNHNIVCYGYSITIPRKGKFLLERALELEIPRNCWNRLQQGESLTDGDKLYTPDMVMGAPRRGIKVVYCTDTRPTQALADHAKDADLLICEGMYGEPGKEAKAREYKHMTFYEAAEIAKAANPKEMWLTHFSPSLAYPEEFMGGVRKIFANAKAGKDGMTAELEFEDEK